MPSTHDAASRPLAAAPPAQGLPGPVAWQDLIDQIDCGIVVWSADDRLVLCNQEFRRLYGPLADQLTHGRSFAELLQIALDRGLIPEAVGHETQWLAERLRAHAQPAAPMLRQMPDGRWRRVTEARLADGSLLAFSVDVTELMQQAGELQQAVQAARIARETAEAASMRLTDAIEALPDGFALYDADDRLVACNQRYRELYDASAPAMKLGTRFEDVLRYGLAQGQYPQARGNEEEWLAERLHRHRHPGPPVIQELPGNRWLRVDERITREGAVAGVRSDVTELVRREQQLVELNDKLGEARTRLETLSDTDALTGIANRRQFDRRLAEEWSRVLRHGTPLSLLLLDVDHFKLYNDHYGHQAGDTCLHRVAQVLAMLARRSTDLVARYGGEEFAMLLPHTAAEAAAIVAAQCLHALDAEALAHAASPVAPHITLSVGVAVAERQDSGAASALVQAADRALYRAKTMGRHRVEMASPPPRR